MHPRALLARYGYSPKKRFGQNFLMDAGAAARIAALASEGARSQRVVEIGPGTGALTRALIDAGLQVTAVDLDPDMIAILRTRGDLASAEIVHDDALTFDYAGYARGGPWRMAGNLPYNIATPLLMRLIEMRDGPDAIVAMIQRDVADRLAARPGTRAYGSLSVAVQYAMTVERAFTLGPRFFYPRPKVDSTVVRLCRRERPAAEVDDEARFLQVVRAAFAYRRKTLANSLSLAIGIDRSVTAAALERLQIDTEIRGEQLAITDFARLAAGLPR